MKKIFILSITAITLASLVGCGNKESNPLEGVLESLRQGFVMEGEIKQKAQFLDSSEGNFTGEELLISFPYKYTYECREFEGIERVINGVEEDGSVYNIMNDSYVKGDDGKVYFQELSYKNTIELTPAVNSAGAQVNYEYFFANPFDYILESDFTLVEGNKYNIDLDKASFISSKFFDSFDVAFDEVIISAECVIENNTLKSMYIKPEKIEDYQTVGSSNRYYDLFSEVVMNFSEVGTASVKKVETRPHLDAHDELQNAFDTLGDNYTLSVMYYKADDGEEEEPYERKYYFTEEGLLYRSNCEYEDEVDPQNDVALKIHDDGSLDAFGYNEVTNKWTQAAANQNGLSAYGSFNISDIKPVIKGVAAEIFDYSKSLDQYLICEELQSYIGAIAFIPYLETMDDKYLNGYGTDCIVTLNDNGQLDNIEISYLVDNSFLYRDVTFVLTFENIGTTTLPLGISF